MSGVHYTCVYSRYSAFPHPATNGAAGTCTVCRNSKRKDELLESAREKRTPQFDFEQAYQKGTTCN
jgi:hypothetical protein